MTILHLLTGSYAAREEEGIKLWKFDTATGELEQQDGIKGVPRPSFLAVHPGGEMFVSGSEDFNGELVSCEVAWDDVKIRERSRREGNGDHPAYVTIDRSGKWLLSVNYSGGNVNVFRLENDNTIGEQTDSVQHEGSGPNTERQDSAHPHSVIETPEENLFAVSDLGTDAIYFYRLDPQTGKLSLQQALAAEEGSGPRHLAYHPAKPMFYSLGELDSTVTVYSFDAANEIERVQRVSLLPSGYDGDNTAAEVAVSEDGKILYASNRGDDSIVTFTIDETGKLHSPEFTSSGGKGPRHFSTVPGGGWLIVGNEQSDSLIVLRLENGRPVELVQEIKTDSPVCVKFIEQSE